MNPVIVIPARLGSTRLPNKPLADIQGEAMIVRVWRQAVAAAIGPVLVAAAEREIAEAIWQVGGTAVLTDAQLPTGSDRVWMAAEMVDPARDFSVVINVQGDFPMIEPALLRQLLAGLENPAVDIATLAFAITDPAERHNDSVVKVALELEPGRSPPGGRALYFSRLPVPWQAAVHYHHVGLYAYRRPALARFVALPRSAVERSESLEQLRALAAGMYIDCSLIDSAPFGVDTAADLERARALIAAQSPARGTKI